MRTCIRCNTKMVEDCGVKIQGAGYTFVITENENIMFGSQSIGKPKAAVCPNCGEISFYLEDVKQLRG